MPRYYLKPVFWNTQGYQKPSGVRATGGYPLEHGYGHEEWNNATFMNFEDRGNRFKAFHSEGLGNAPVDENDGQIFLFLYASHNGVQQLVGAIGKATCLALESRKPAREKLVQRLGIQSLWRDAWDLQIVRERHHNNKRAFMLLWNRDVNWIPNWKCPEALFFWPQTPITLDPMRITGKRRLLNEFKSYTEIGPDAASRVMASVPAEARTNVWSRIRDEMDVSFEDEDADVADIRADTRVGETTKQALIPTALSFHLCPFSRSN